MEVALAALVLVAGPELVNPLAREHPVAVRARSVPTVAAVTRARRLVM
jgi:hypothetical protein